jgi:hypothetical protein
VRCGMRNVMAWLVRVEGGRRRGITVVAQSLAGGHGGGALRCACCGEARRARVHGESGGVTGARGGGHNGWEHWVRQRWPELYRPSHGAAALCANRVGESAEEGGE